MTSDWSSALRRWVEAGLLPQDSAEAIEQWEREQLQQVPAASRLSAPIRVLLVLGAVLLAAGLLLLVAAHWDALAPGWRFALMLTLVAGLHGLGSAAAASQSAAATALHAVGTAAFGGGVFLAGQIFHLEAHWPAGLLLWGLGAALGWVLLRQWPQLALLAVLLPGWLVSEWSLIRQDLGLPFWAYQQVTTAGVLLLALAFLAAQGSRRGSTPARQVLLWIGGLVLLPASGIWALLLRSGSPARASNLASAGLDMTTHPPVLALGVAVALGGPLLCAWLLRRRACWPVGLAAGWMLVSYGMTWLEQGLVAALLPFLWWLIGSLALVAWGVAERRAERVNLGTTLAAGTVLAFYASEVMSRLDRSFSLIGLGALCLAGGWLLERRRRQWLRQLGGAALGEQP